MQVVGIGGGSAVGQTTLARRAADLRPGTKVLSLDDNFRTDREAGPFTAPDAAGARHFDLNHPDAVDWSRVHAALEDHRRFGTALLIVEGTFALVSPDMRGQLMLRVFLAAPEELRLEWKAARNLAERGVLPEVTRRNHAPSAGLPAVRGGQRGARGPRPERREEPGRERPGPPESPALSQT